mmetsp:Transcript_8290/g.18862  ORF Transcript_8290/g.18862 Transcript_8290/m.18862 type:complete len:204 (-) Transcript_8290:96-707(-)
MGRTSKKPQFNSQDADEDYPEDNGTRHTSEFEQKYIESLINQKPRMSWEDFKEKHKEQLQDRLGSGIEKEQADYRRLLDEERNRKLSKGTNNKHLSGKSKKDKKSKKEKKEKKKEKKRLKREKKEKKKKAKSERGMEGEDGNKKRKRDSTSSSSDSSSSSSSSSSSDSDVAEKKRKRKEEKQKDSGPVRLSDFHSGRYDSNSD